MTEIEVESNNIYLILDGSKTINKESFLSEIGLLLKFSNNYNHTWDGLEDCLKDIVSINSWKSNDTASIEDVIDENTKVNIIWFDPVHFSTHNPIDFLLALDMLKEVSKDESNPLQFALAGQLRDIHVDSYK